MGYPNATIHLFRYWTANTTDNNIYDSIDDDMEFMCNCCKQCIHWKYVVTPIDSTSKFNYKFVRRACSFFTKLDHPTWNICRNSIYGYQLFPTKSIQFLAIDLIQ